MHYLACKRKKDSVFERVLDKIKVVYHSQKKSGNFGWDVNGNIILIFPNEKFSN